MLICLSRIEGCLGLTKLTPKLEPITRGVQALALSTRAGYLVTNINARLLLNYSDTQIGCRSNLGHRPVMRPNISGAAPNRRWRHLPRHLPAPLQRTPPRPGQTANAIFKVIAIRRE